MLRFAIILVVFFFLLQGATFANSQETNITSKSESVAGETFDIKDALESGRIALADGFGKVAESHFSRALESKVGTPEEIKTANDGLLNALLLQKNYDALLARVDVLVDDGSISLGSSAYWKALVKFRQSNYSDAVAILEPFQKVMPDASLGENILRLLALSHLKSGNVEEAIADFKLFAKRFPNSKNLDHNRLDWGKALIFQGKYEDAVKVFQPILNNNDQRLVNDARYWIGKAFIMLGDIDKGLDALETLLGSANVPEDLRVNAVIAVVEVRGKVAGGQGGKVDEGAKSGGLVVPAVLSGDDGAKSSRPLAPAGHENVDPAVLENIQLLTNTLSQVKGAESKKLLSYELCNVLLDGRMLDKAAPRIKAYITENRDEVKAAELQLKMGDALLEAGKYEEAVAIYQQYLEIFVNAGGHARARLGSGWALMGVKRYAEAALAFEKAYDLFETPAEKKLSLFKVGDALFKNDQYKNAIIAYERFIKEYPESKYTSKAMFQIGVCQELQEKYDEAKVTFEKVSKNYPKSIDAKESLLRIGQLYEMKKEWAKAQVIYERMMKLYPDGIYFVKALKARGVAKYQQWAPDALADFEQLVEKYPDSEEAEYAMFMRAMCLYRLGRDKQALKICKDFIKRYSDSVWAPDVRFWIGRFDYNNGDYESAEEQFMAFVHQFPNNELADSAVYRAGMTAIKRKEYVHAIELFGTLVKNYPKSGHLAEARFWQADAMTQLGKFSGAILVFDEVINTFPESYLVPLAWGRKGDCQFTLGAEDAERYKEAVRSYRVVTQSPQARWNLVLQAEYKIGLSLEKMKRGDEALEQYYSKVIVPFLLEREKGRVISEASKVWFTRGALAATDIVTEKKDWRQLISILNRIVEADVAVSADAKKKIGVIESEKWWLFY